MNLLRNTSGGLNAFYRSKNWGVDIDYQFDIYSWKAAMWLMYKWDIAVILFGALLLML